LKGKGVLGKHSLTPWLKASAAGNSPAYIYAIAHNRLNVVMRLKEKEILFGNYHCFEAASGNNLEIVM